jgi:predicted kinase
MDTLLQRVGSRRGDVSDATEEIVREQASRRPAAGAWNTVSAAGSLADEMARVLKAIN